ncbi:helix-turn-helix domain-containing protein [Longispora sp. NPDC051575]|uniref:helix-turn-helix domain-containing protein n=1 Tax=Longispora sp. NPDC051575 TaxID=3154943 RepID=UPI0034228453
MAGRVGLSLANLSALRNGRARAIWFSTLTALCDELGLVQRPAVPEKPHPGCRDIGLPGVSGRGRGRQRA